MNCVAPVPTAALATPVRALIAAAISVHVFFEAVAFARLTVTLFPEIEAERVSMEAITRVTLMSFPAFPATSAVTENPFEAPQVEEAATAELASSAVSHCISTRSPNFSFLRILSRFDIES